MESIFTKKRGEYVVTYYLVELLERSIEQAGGNTDVEVFIPPVLKKLGYKPPYSQDSILQLLEDLNTMRKEKVEKQSNASTPKSSGGKKTYGQDFFKWVDEVKIDGALLIAMQYDYEKAERAYKTLPYQVIDKIVDLNFKQIWYSMSNYYEAIVLGMGGSLGNEKVDHGTGENTSLEDMAKSLKSMGF